MVVLHSAQRRNRKGLSILDGEWMGGVWRALLDVGAQDPMQPMSSLARIRTHLCLDLGVAADACTYLAV